MDKHRKNTFAQLAILGFDAEEAAQLVRASATLHTWAEHECNGTIQRDETTDKPYWYDEHSGKRLRRTSDRETGALRRIREVLSIRNERQQTSPSRALGFYHQTDPRGCALYILRPGDVPAGEDVGAYYSRGIAVVP